MMPMSKDSVLWTPRAGGWGSLLDTRTDWRLAYSALLMKGEMEMTRKLLH